MTLRKLACGAAIAAAFAAASMAPIHADLTVPDQYTEAPEFRIPLEAAPPPEQSAPPAAPIPDIYLPVPEGPSATSDDDTRGEETKAEISARSGQAKQLRPAPTAARKENRELTQIDRLPLTRSQRLSRTALVYRGVSYRWGGFSRLNGFDCSGLTRYLYLKEGIDLPHSAKLQFRMGTPVESGDLRTGDLVFFNTNGPLSHVGMYIGNGAFVHAANPRRGVTVNRLTDTYYKKRYAGARRYVLHQD